MSTHYDSVADFIIKNKLSNKLKRILAEVPTKTEDDLNPTSNSFLIILNGMGHDHKIGPQHKKDLIAWLKLTAKLFM